MADKIFSLEVLKARKGDCLLLHFGTTGEPALGLIDGGPGGVYKPHLRPRLEQLRAERGLTETDMLPLDLCMLSHIDDDHVKALLQLTQELVDAKKNNKPRLVNIIDLWHNAFDDIIDNDADELAGAVNSRFGTASLTGDIALAEVDSPDAQTAVAAPHARQRSAGPNAARQCRGPRDRAQPRIRRRPDRRRPRRPVSRLWQRSQADCGRPDAP